MSKNFKTAFNDQYPEGTKVSKGSSEVITWVRNYLEEETAKYKENSKAGLMCFGKYASSTPAQVAQLQDGVSYLQWVFKQSWFDEGRPLYGEIESILKKTANA